MPRVGVGPTNTLGFNQELSPEQLTRQGKVIIFTLCKSLIHLSRFLSFIYAHGCLFRERAVNAGLEPATIRLTAGRSANWAKWPSFIHQKSRPMDIYLIRQTAVRFIFGCAMLHSPLSGYAAICTAIVWLLIVPYLIHYPLCLIRALLYRTGWYGHTRGALN